MKIKTLLLCIATLAAIQAPVFSQKKKSLPPEFSIKKSETEGHMRFLAADELLGRRTGEQGNLVAARYIAEQFRKFGVTPVPGVTAGTNSYYQNVPFEKMGANGTGEITADADMLKSGTDWILMSGDAADLKARIGLRQLWPGKCFERLERLQRSGRKRQNRVGSKRNT